MISCENIILKNFEKRESLNPVKITNSYGTNIAEIHD